MTPPDSRPKKPEQAPPPTGEGGRRTADGGRRTAEGGRRTADNAVGTRALLLIDHGSRRSEAHAHLEALARAVRVRRPGLAVYIAHLELAPPTIEDAIAACAAAGERSIDVLPLFLAPGNHATRDIPSRIAAAASHHAGLEVRLLDPLGEHPGLADWVLTAAER